MSRALAKVARRTADTYNTPDAVAKALVRLLPLGPGDVLWEPHVGGGAFARALTEVSPYVRVSDADPAAPGLQTPDALGSAVIDFLDSTATSPWTVPADWIVGNPPYGEAEAHIRHALRLTPHVAFLLRLGILESTTRMPLWKDHPPRKVWVLTERPSFTDGGTDSAAYGFFWWSSEWTAEPTLDWVSWRKER